MIRAHKIRLNPTPEQAVHFRQACGVARFTYNWGLAHIKDALSASDKPPTALALKKQFNAIKRQEFPWTYNVTKCAAETGFQNLGKALDNFWSSKKGQRKGKRIGFPKFKSKKGRRQSFTLANDKFSVDGHELRVPRLGRVNMAEPLRFAGKVMSGVVSCTAGRWYISIVMEVADEVRPNAGQVLGVDVGVNTLATVSNGLVFENQKHLAHAHRRLKRLQQSVARKQKGSRNRAKAVLKLARAHERVADLRRDAIHKMTTALAGQAAVIGIEDLNVAGMLRNHRLARAISDAALGEVARQLEYKVPAHGGQVVRVGRFFPSSKLHNECGAINDALTLSDREWTCPTCGGLVDRDVNAALNIRDEAARILASRSVVATSSVIACGQDVSPAFAAAVLDEAGISRGVHFCTPGK